MTPIRFLLSLPAPGTQARGSAGDLSLRRIVAPGVATRHRAAIWIADDRDLLQNTASVAVVGRVFDRASHRRFGGLPANPTGAASPKVRAGSLLSHLWGAWFAVLTDVATGQMYVARDPTSHLPVYRRDFGQHILYASEVALLAEAAAASPTVSWRRLADHLLFPELRQANTCLVGISEVASGALTPVTSNGEAPIQLWEPWAFTREAQRDGAAAAAALRETTLFCIGAWAAGSDRVAVAASGGLDSSIICAALAAQKRPFDCITIATADPSGDESAYVRPLAAALGARMVRQIFDPAGIDLTRPVSALLPRPVRKAFMQELRRAMQQGAQDLGADVVFDGNGGDNLFCYLHSAAPIIDRFWQDGLGFGLLSSFLDMCRLTESDVPTMLRACLRRLTRPAAPAWIPDNRLLLAHDITSAPVPCALTPWRLNARRAPGKAAHIGLIQRAQNFTHDLAGCGEPLQFSPLMSQPLLEFCLSVPTWQWCHAGINRSLAREAFRADLPATTLSRTAKAGPDSFLRTVLHRNRRLIREMLHDGHLAQQQILDIAAVEQAVTVDEQADDPIINRLLDLVEAEAWAGSWIR